MSELDLERELDRVFAGPPESFIAERDALAGVLKKAGDREAAARVKALPKPVVTAWAMNVVALREAALVERLRSSGEDLRRAQLENAPAEQIHRAMAAQRATIEAVVQAACEVLRAGGAAVTPSNRERLQHTATAIAAHGRASTQPPPGRLPKDLAPPSFDVLAGLNLVAREPGEGTAELRPTGAGAQSPEPEAPLGATRLAREAHLRLKAQLRAAEEELAHAQAAADEATLEANDLRQRAAQAAERAAATREHAEHARAHVTALAAQVRQAAEALEFFGPAR